jgi:putative Mn2+ efflux pump MntP
LIALLELYLVAVAISLDTFAASMALGTRLRPRGWLRVALVFALIGGAFPVAGMAMGLLASGAMAQVAGGLGALVLAGLGGWFLHGAWKGSEAGGAGHLPGLDPAAEGLPGAIGAPGSPEAAGGGGRAAGSDGATLPLGGLVLLSVGLSSDNLLVGLGVGLQGGTTLLLGVLTSMSVFGATLTGLWLGRRKRLRFGRVAEGLAGVLLLLLAAWLMVDWLQGLRG